MLSFIRVAVAAVSLHSKWTVIKIDVHTREWRIGLIGLVMTLVELYGRLSVFELEKWLNTLSRAYWVILLEVCKTVVLRVIGILEVLAQEVPEEKNIPKCPRLHYCDILCWFHFCSSEASYFYVLLLTYFLFDWLYFWCHV